MPCGKGHEHLSWFSFYLFVSYHFSSASFLRLRSLFRLNSSIVTPFVENIVFLVICFFFFTHLHESKTQCFLSMDYSRERFVRKMPIPSSVFSAYFPLGLLSQLVLSSPVKEIAIGDRFFFFFYPTRCSLSSTFPHYSRVSVIEFLIQ